MANTSRRQIRWWYLFWGTLGAVVVLAVLLTGSASTQASPASDSPLEGTSTFTPTPTPTTQTPTIIPTATATGFYCTFYSLGASSSCSGLSTYNYTFDFYNTCPNWPGSILLDFDVAPDGTGPWTTLEERTLQQAVGTRVQGSFTEASIPPQYHWYRIRIWVNIMYRSDTNVTPEEYLCNLPPSPTPCPSCPTATPTACAVGWSQGPNPGLGWLHAVDALSADNVWAAGTYQATSSLPETMIEHWDGTLWQVVPSVHGNGPNNYLYGIDALAANDVWAVGQTYSYGSDQMLIEHWDGSAWSIVPAPTGFQFSELRAVSALSSNDVWAVGDNPAGSYEGDMVFIHWDGNAWSLVPAPPAPHYPFLQSVKAIASNDVWAVGYYQACGTNQALTMHWDGSQWSVIPNAGECDSRLFAVTGLSGDDVWAVGSYVANQTFTMHWNGSAWSVVPGAPLQTSSVLRGVIALSSNDVWAVGDRNIYGNNQQTLATHWDGSQWSVVSSPNPGADINQLEGITAAAPGNLWAVGAFGSVYTGEQSLIEHYTGSCPPPQATPSATPSATLTATATAAAMEATPSATLPAGTTPSATPTATLAATATEATASPTSCSIQFTDVPVGSTFYPYIHCLACLGIVNGYPGGTFKPNNNVTRGQLSKVVANSAGFSDPQPSQMFQDVPLGSTFQVYIGRLASRGYISGYPCGGPLEPCVPPGNLPYFRPNNNAARGQISKIDANAAGFADPPNGQQFEDVAVGSAFYTYTYRLVTRGVMSGYACGGAGEPCVPPGNLAYFRSNNNATRGQTSKIVANTFFPDCNTHER